MKIALLICLVFLSSSAFALDANDKFCTNPETPSIAKLCVLSKSINVPVDKVGVALVFASTELIGTFCNFSFTDKFLNSKMNMERDPDIAKANKILVSRYNGLPPPGYNGNKPVFCKVQYDLLGPRTKEYFFN